MNTIRRQSGSVLVISLLMLLAMTLLSVSTLETSNIDVQIVRNVQNQQSLEAFAQQAVERTLSDSANFRAPLPGPVNTTPVDGITVTVQTPVCLGQETLVGDASRYSTGQPVAWKRTHWEVVAGATDDNTGASVTIHQGVTLDLPSINCP